MGKLDRLFGLAAKALDLDEGDRRKQPRATPRETPVRPAPPGAYAPSPARDPYTPPPAGAARANHRLSTGDRAAIARYDHLLETADPHRLEQIHREAFARLTPAQRDQVRARMDSELGPQERPASASSDDLARAAGRAEASSPGRLRGILARAGGRGAASAVGGAALGVLGVVAAGAAGSAIAGPLLGQAESLGVDFDALAQGVDLEALTGGLDGEALAGAADGLVGSAGEAVSGLGDTASDWGQRLGDLGIPGLGDLFGR